MVGPTWLYKTAQIGLKKLDFLVLMYDISLDLLSQNYEGLRKEKGLKHLFYIYATMLIPKLF